MAALRQGLHVYCRCGNQATLSPAKLAEAPDAQIYAFKSRLRCKRCGLPGTADEIEIRIFVEAAPFTPQFAMRGTGTPPQRLAH